MRRKVVFPGFEDRYEVDEFGNIYGCEVVRKNKHGYMLKKECLLRSGNDRRGYPQVVLSKDKRRKTVKVHRLIALAFCAGKTANKSCVNHIDGNKENNHYLNLEWSSYKENSQHAFKNGLNRGVMGSKNAGSKLTEKDVLHIRGEYDKITQFKKYGALIGLSNGYGVDKTLIINIVRNRVWKHV